MPPFDADDYRDLLSKDPLVQEAKKAAVSFADIERRHSARRGDVSDPSTTTAEDVARKVIDDALRAAMRIDYAEGRLGWIEPWMLDPDDSYPFVEWDDLDMRERAFVLTKRVGWAIERNRLQIEDTCLSALTFDLEAIPDRHDDQMDATKAAADRLQRAVIESEKVRKNSGQPVPAKKGHLMAEGSTLARVRGMLKDGSALKRKVQFLEPVNAFTMLYGDRIAVGGDMLTACTTEDTQEVELKDSVGRPRTVYISRAVSL